MLDVNSIHWYKNTYGMCIRMVLEYMYLGGGRGDFC
jgi:hypothetical protein